MKILEACAAEFPVINTAKGGEHARDAPALVTEKYSTEAVARLVARA